MNDINKTKILEFLKGLGTIGLYFALAIVGNVIFGSLYDNSNKFIAGAAEIGTYIIILLGIGFIYREKLKEDFKNFKKSNIDIAFKNWLIGLGVMVCANLIITFIVGDIPANEATNRELLNHLPITNTIIMVIIGPLLEEITFRLSFKKAFSKWYTFALTTGLMFGLAHIADFKLLEFLFIIPYGALGFFFAKALFETDNVYTSYLAHMIHNALCILLIILF